MGYWINHDITATGNKKDVEAYMAKLTQRRPTELNDEGDIVWSEEEFSFYNIISPPEEMIMSGDWWEDKGSQWRQKHWESYDAPAEHFNLIGSGVGKPTTSAYLSMSTKYDWPVNIFHELIKQYPNLEFSIWSEGEESEAIEITGSNGISIQTDYAAPNSHADWVDREKLDNCLCSYYKSPDNWFSDCPRDDSGIYKVQVTYTHYVKTYDMDLAISAVIAYDNNFDMPSATELIKYGIEPKILAETVDTIPDSE